MAITLSAALIANIEAANPIPSNPRTAEEWIIGAINYLHSGGGGGGGDILADGSVDFTGTETFGAGAIINGVGLSIGTGVAATVELDIAGDVKIANGSATITIIDQNAIQIHNGVGGGSNLLGAAGDVILGTTAVFTNGMLNIQGDALFLGANTGDGNGTNIELNDTNETIAFSAADGLIMSGAITAYANNAAALAGIGAGKLYYTDTAGEYIVKLSH